MSDPIFYIRRGDVLPLLEIDALNAGAAFDLTGVESATFKMRPMNGSTYVVEAAATVVDEDGGRIRYTWQDGDTDVVGNYYGEIVLAYSGGRTMRIPTQDAIAIVVLP